MKRKVLRKLVLGLGASMVASAVVLMTSLEASAQQRESNECPFKRDGWAEMSNSTEGCW